MSQKFINRACHYSTRSHLFFSVKKIILVKIILVILFFHGCAFLSTKQNSQFFLTVDDVETIIQNVKEQEDIVSEFYSTGTLRVPAWILDTSLDIFIAGKKTPLTFKMEISHSWGKPLYYFLIKEDTLEIRDFIEKKQYTGKLTPDNLARFIPNMDCSPDMIWSFLRGYPQLLSYSRVYEVAPGVLSIEGRNKNTLGKIIVSPGNEIKEAESSPPRFLNMRFTDFRQIEEINYAEKTVLEEIKGKRDLTLKRKKVIFNKNIPDAIFTLKNQPVFEVVSLDDL